MKEDKEKEIYARFPYIFKDKDLPPEQTCLYWGLDIGDGWSNLFINMLEEIEAYEATDHVKQKIENETYHKVVAVQVKEKFGGLRFYYDGGDENISEIVSRAEKLSRTICESCSAPGKPTKSGWIRTLCDDCEENRYKKTKE